MHALVAHGDAVGHGNGAELHREPAAGMDAFFGALGEPVQGEVAGSDFVPGTRDADLGLGEVIVPHPDSPEHSACRSRVNAVSDNPASGFDVRLGGGFSQGVLTHGSKSMTPQGPPTTGSGAFCPISRKKWPK